MHKAQSLECKKYDEFLKLNSQKIKQKQSIRKNLKIELYGLLF